ncbi:MAG: hypothetical protein L3K04_04520 [Thermoplasmata archaeon]|nr:hypothetical protein [Thermoplasmata archaeon]
MSAEGAATGRLDRSHRRIPECIGLLLLLLIPTVVGLTESQRADVSTLTPQELGFMAHINHIVFVVLENHAYDNYYGRYCLQVNPVCPMAAAGIPAGTCVPLNATLPTGPCVRPFNNTPANWTVSGLMPHDWNASNLSWNHGAMNGFYAAEGSGLNPFGTYNGSTAPIYWDLAQEYGLSDRFFTSVLDYSLPNHWHFVAGAAPQAILYAGSDYTLHQNVSAFIRNDHTYLNESNATPTIEDLLLNSSVSWKYYEFALGSYASAIRIVADPNGTDVASTGRAYDYFNPQAARAESYNQSFANHYVVNSQFYADAANGSLPALSWVIPPGQDADHPPDNSTYAQGWLGSIVNSVENSPDWNSTAIYVTWDDYGGFYDQVDPPQFLGQQLGFRVPLLEISPYTPAGVVSDSFGFFESVLHLMEWRFHLGCLTALDCGAPLPLWGFDFQAPPRAPLQFPTNVSVAHYPYIGPALSPFAHTHPYVPPEQYVVFPSGQAPDVD